MISTAIQNASIHNPFGALSSFTFNGKENDNEVYDVTGSFQDYGMRMYDTRVCRFISIDPLTKKYPYLTPYQFASNTPIIAIDLDGLETAAGTGQRNTASTTREKSSSTATATSGSQAPPVPTSSTTTGYKWASNNSTTIVKPVSTSEYTIGVTTQVTQKAVAATSSTDVKTPEVLATPPAPKIQQAVSTYVAPHVKSIPSNMNPSNPLPDIGTGAGVLDVYSQISGNLKGLSKFVGWGSTGMDMGNDVINGDYGSAGLTFTYAALTAPYSAEFFLGKAIVLNPYSLKGAGNVMMNDAMNHLNSAPRNQFGFDVNSSEYNEAVQDEKVAKEIEKWLKDK
jgi:RHS repeat-associated protein